MLTISPSDKTTDTIQEMIARLTLVRNSVFTRGAEKKSVDEVIKGLKKYLVDETN